MFATTSDLNEFQVVTLCVIATFLMVFTISAVTVGILGVLHHRREVPHQVANHEGDGV